MKNLELEGTNLDMRDGLMSTKKEDETLDLTLLEKLQEGKKIFMEGGVKKSGYNSYQKYHYYDLKDIVPAVINICDILRISTKFQFTSDEATLRVHDLDTGIYIDYHCPLPHVYGEDPKRAMQEIGACQTYARRYLYLAMLDITEADVIDIGQPKNESNTNNGNIKPMKSKIKPKNNHTRKIEEKGSADTVSDEPVTRSVDTETPYDGVIPESDTFNGYKLGLKYAKQIQKDGLKATTQRIKNYAKNQLSLKEISEEEHEEILNVLDNVKEVTD